MDFSGIPDLGRFLMVILVLFLLTLPFAAWKVIELIVRVCHHIHFS